MASDSYAERLERIGYQRVTVFVREDRAELLKAMAARDLANDLVEIADSVFINENGIEDDRFDFFEGQRARGAPDVHDLQIEWDGFSNKNSKQAKELASVINVLLDIGYLQRQERVARKNYETAEAAKKYDCGLHWSIISARLYAYTKKAVADYRLYLIRYNPELTEGMSNDAA